MSQETRPMKSGPNWPVSHTVANALKSATILPAPGNGASHYVSGFIATPLTDSESFSIIRRSCVYFNTTDTWTAADHGTDFDWGTAAADGHFALEVWVKIPTATGAHATLMKRGDPAADGWLLEITSAGLPKFTAHDSSDAVTITGATNIFAGWHLITVVCERSSTTGLNIYVDGVSDATAVTTVGMDLTLDGGTTVVSTGVSSKETWLGPVGMYIGSSAALSAATVLSNYNEGIGRKYTGQETGLAAAWNNDEGLGVYNYEMIDSENNKVTTSGTTWSPAKADGSTAAVPECGPPFDPDNSLDAVGPFGLGLIDTEGMYQPIICTFPQAIKIGRNNPLRLHHTDGSWYIVLFGFTAGHA